MVATIGDKRITWGDVKVQMRGADYRATLAEFYVDNDEERLARLQEYIDNTSDGRQGDCRRYEERS